MASKYLSSLSEQEYKNLTNKLLNIQQRKCFICEKEIDAIHETNIDHIIPLNLKGKDNDQNFALTHESCNKSKQDSHLQIARILCRLDQIQEKECKKDERFSLKQVLSYYEGSKFDFKFKKESDYFEYNFQRLNENEGLKARIYKDYLSEEESVFIEIPIQYIYHDDTINPRGINRRSIGKLIKEFYKKNPQLHVSLARVDDNKVRIFDGQHKAAAQILLGSERILTRLFLSPIVERLTETNTNAGSTLRQIAFDKAIMRQLNNTLYKEKISVFQRCHGKKEDDFSFSENDLIEYFKGESKDIKKYIIDGLKYSITHHQKNKLTSYINFEGKAKGLPISHSTFDKTFLNLFINSKIFLSADIGCEDNPRELEIEQCVRLINIIAEEIYMEKFDKDIGIWKIEENIIKKKLNRITDDHLVAYRMGKEEIMYNWLQYIIEVIKSYFYTCGTRFNEDSLLQNLFNEQLFTNIKKAITNLKNMPLWRDRAMASTIFSGKKNYQYWNAVFSTGRTPDGAEVLTSPINTQELIK